MTKDRLFAVDAMALAFRSFPRFPRPLTTSSEKHPQAIYGGLMFLSQLIEREQPDYHTYRYRLDAKTFRHELYSEYKLTEAKCLRPFGSNSIFDSFKPLAAIPLKYPA